MCLLVGISSHRVSRPRYYLHDDHCPDHGNRAWRRDGGLAAIDRHRAGHGAAHFALAGVLSRDGTARGNNDGCESRCAHNTGGCNNATGARSGDASASQS